MGFNPLMSASSIPTDSDGYRVNVRFEFQSANERVFDSNFMYWYRVGLPDLKVSIR